MFGVNFNVVYFVSFKLFMHNLEVVLSAQMVLAQGDIPDVYRANTVANKHAATIAERDAVWMYFFDRRLFATFLCQTAGSRTQYESQNIVTEMLCVPGVVLGLHGPQWHVENAHLKHRAFL